MDANKVKVKMHNRKSLYLLVTIFLLGLSAMNGCLSDQNHLSGSPQAPTRALTPPSLVTPTAASQSIQIHWPTKAPPPAPTGLPPTWTALPTYPPAQSRQMVMDLYENNPCKLPCWWGITPGKSDWREVWQYLERFAINKPPWDNLLLESKNHPGYMYYQVLLDVPQTVEEAKYYSSLNYLAFMINIKTFTVDYIDVNAGNIYNYTIPGILAAYGKPAEIYVNFESNPVPQYSGVSLSLYYPQHGFISTHFTTVVDEEWNKPKLTACFQKVTNLHLWPKDRDLGYSEALAFSSMNLIPDNWRSIAKVSDFSVDTFYRTYKGIQEQPCIELMTEKQ